MQLGDWVRDEVKQRRETLHLPVLPHGGSICTFCFVRHGLPLSLLSLPPCTPPVTDAPGTLDVLATGDQRQVS